MPGFIKPDAGLSSQKKLIPVQYTVSQYMYTCTVLQPIRSCEHLSHSRAAISLRFLLTALSTMTLHSADEEYSSVLLSRLASSSVPPCWSIVELREPGRK